MGRHLRRPTKGGSIINDESADDSRKQTRHGRVTMSDITFEEIRDCDKTIEVNALALLQLYRDGLFDNLGNSASRYAKRELRDMACQVAGRCSVSNATTVDDLGCSSGHETVY